MAEIEVGSLGDRLTDEEVAELRKALEKVGVKKLPSGEEGDAATIASALNDDAVQELLDRLDDYDASCDIYVPADFEGHIAIGDYRIGSVTALLDALDEVREDLALEEEDEAEEEEEEDDDDSDEEEEEEEEPEEEEDEEDHDTHVRHELETRLRKTWKPVHQGAQAARDRKLSLFIRLG